MSTAVQTMHGIVTALKKYSESTGMVGADNLEDAVRSVTAVSSLEEFRSQFVNDITSIEKYPDVNERLREVCGIILEGEDVGAVTSANAGGSTVKNAESIVPEDGQLTDAPLPEVGATTPITYTGNDGNSFTFYVKWLDSFTAAYNCESKSDYVEACELIGDSRYFQDFSQSGLWGISADDLTQGVRKILVGLNGWWLRESAKLAYDSYGLDLNGKTVLIQLVGGGGFEGAAAATDGNSKNGTPSDVINLGINLGIYYGIDAYDANGKSSLSTTYLDRVIAHEMVHGVMYAAGMIKENSTPEFFREGIAEFVIGGDDSNAGHTEAIPTLAQNSETLLKNLTFADGYLNTYAYPAGYMFLRYLCKQTASTSMYFMENSSQTADFNGNNTVVNNFIEGNKINYNTDFFSAYSTKDGNDFIVSNSDGNLLVVRDSADKTINFVAENATAYGFMTSTSGTVSATDTEIFSAVLGAHYKSNDVYAGRGGSYLWGGFGGNDNLFGNSGVDYFAYTYKDGNDTIQNAQSQDSVFLNDMTLDKISYAQINDGGVSLQFVDGGSLTVNGTPSTFTVNNVTYRADYQNKSWTQES